LHGFSFTQKRSPIREASPFKARNPDVKHELSLGGPNPIRPLTVPRRRNALRVQSRAIKTELPPAPPGQPQSVAGGNPNIIFPRSQLPSLWCGLIGMSLPKQSDPIPSIFSPYEKATLIQKEKGAPPRNVNHFPLTARITPGAACEPQCQRRGPHSGWVGMPRQIPSHIRGVDAIQLQLCKNWKVLPQRRFPRQERERDSLLRLQPQLSGGHSFNFFHPCLDLHPENTKDFRGVHNMEAFFLFFCRLHGIVLVPDLLAFRPKRLPRYAAGTPWNGGYVPFFARFLCWWLFPYQVVCHQRGKRIFEAVFRTISSSALSNQPLKPPLSSTTI